MPSVLDPLFSVMPYVLTEWQRASQLSVSPDPEIQGYFASVLVYLFWQAHTLFPFQVDPGIYLQRMKKIGCLENLY